MCKQPRAEKNQSNKFGMCAGQTVNRLAAEAPLVVSMKRGILYGAVLTPSYPQPHLQGRGPSRREGLHSSPGLGGSGSCSFAVVSAPVALLGSNYLAIWLVFLWDGHMHISNCRVLFASA